MKCSLCKPKKSYSVFKQLHDVKHLGTQGVTVSVRIADTLGVALVLVNHDTNTRAVLCSVINEKMGLKFSKKATGWHSN